MNIFVATIRRAESNNNIKKGINMFRKLKILTAVVFGICGIGLGELSYAAQPDQCQSTYIACTSTDAHCSSWNNIPGIDNTPAQNCTLDRENGLGWPDSCCNGCTSARSEDIPNCTCPDSCYFKKQPMKERRRTK
jgi:hypothetical protein